MDRREMFEKEEKGMGEKMVKEQTEFGKGAKE